MAPVSIRHDRRLRPSGCDIWQRANGRYRPSRLSKLDRRRPDYSPRCRRRHRGRPGSQRRSRARFTPPDWSRRPPATGASAPSHTGGAPPGSGPVVRLAAMSRKTPSRMRADSRGYEQRGSWLRIVARIGGFAGQLGGAQRSIEGSSPPTGHGRRLSVVESAASRSILFFGAPAHDRGVIVSSHFIDVVRPCAGVLEIGEMQRCWTSSRRSVRRSRPASLPRGQI